MNRLDIIKKIGQHVSFQYEINWDYWTDEEAEKMKEDVEEIIPTYEKLFKEIDFGEDLEMIEHVEIVDTLIHGYALQDLLNRRNSIEEILRSI